MTGLRDFAVLDGEKQAMLLLEAREHLEAAFGSNTPFPEQERIIAAYLRRKGVRYNAGPISGSER